MSTQDHSPENEDRHDIWKYDRLHDVQMHVIRANSYWDSNCFSGENAINTQEIVKCLIHARDKIDEILSIINSGVANETTKCRGNKKVCR